MHDGLAPSLLNRHFSLPILNNEVFFSIQLVDLQEYTRTLVECPFLWQFSCSATSGTKIELTPEAFFIISMENQKNRTLEWRIALKIKLECIRTLIKASTYLKQTDLELICIKRA